MQNSTCWKTILKTKPFHLLLNLSILTIINAIYNQTLTDKMMIVWVLFWFCFVIVVWFVFLKFLCMKWSYWAALFNCYVPQDLYTMICGEWPSNYLISTGKTVIAKWELTALTFPIADTNSSGNLNTIYLLQSDGFSLPGGNGMKEWMSEWMLCGYTQFSSDSKSVISLQQKLTTCLISGPCYLFYLLFLACNDSTPETLQQHILMPF